MYYVFIMEFYLKNVFMMEFVLSTRYC